MSGSSCGGPAGARLIRGAGPRKAQNPRPCKLENVPLASHSAPWQRTASGLVLCLLAALFAVEAKMAWYCPDGTPAVQISAAKLQPATAPRIVAHALAATRTAPHFPGVEIAVLPGLMPVVTSRAWRPASARPAAPVPSRFFFYLFFRPPPAR